MSNPPKKSNPGADDLFFLGASDWEVLLDQWQKEEGEDTALSNTVWYSNSHERTNF